MPRLVEWTRSLHMSSVFDLPKEIVVAIRDTLRAVVQILVIFERHRVATVVLLIGICLYWTGWWLTYGVPQQRIQRFYRLVQDKSDIQAAWELLDRNYQKNWAQDPDQLGSGYKTTVRYSEMRISTRGLALNPLGFLFFNSLEFDVSFIVEDRLSRADLSEPIQQRGNCKWLSIAHSTDYPRLADGTLGFATLAMRRRYKQVIGLQRSNWNEWMITNIQNRECGLIFQ